MTENEDKETWTIPVEDRISVIEFLPYEWTASLLAVAAETRLIIFRIKFKNEHQDVDTFKFKICHEVSPGSPVRCIAWSPETSVVVDPPVIKFVTACVDKKMRLITSALTEEDTMVLMEGHTDCINAVTFEPDQGMQIASTGDDCTCRIWNNDGSAKTCITLTSAGVAVCWHRGDIGKIMIAQKNGIIRFYSVDKEQPIMSLETGHTPLMSAHWCPGNPLMAGAVAGNNVYIWDISKSSQPQESRPIHADGALQFLWSQTNPNIFATAGQPKHQIKVTNIKDNQTLLSSTLAVGMSMSWHSKLSILACVGNRKIHLYKLY